MKRQPSYTVGRNVNWYSHYGIQYTHTHIHNTHTLEYYSAIKKNEIMPFAATWMDLEIIIVKKGSQKETDKCQMISLIYGI